MGLNVANRYTFNGPFINLASLSNRSGVYLISVIENDVHQVLDIGESASVKDRVTNHDRQGQWIMCATGRTIYCSTFYCDENTRIAIESELRDFFAPPCGVQ